MNRLGLNKIKLAKREINLSENLPKTAIIGAYGFIGSYFLKAYRNIFPDCIGTARKPKGGNILPFDLLSPNITPLRLAETNHKEALVLAGVTKISECEKNREITWKVNVDGTLELIRQLVSEGIKPIFTSSDYVFDGYTGNYLDDTPSNPNTVYGLQKAEVEARISEICNGRYLIIRPGKTFSLKKGDGSLLDEMASILAKGRTIRAAYDQIFCPIFISDLIEAVAALQVHGASGKINVCSTEAWSRYDMALEMAKAMEFDSRMVHRISLDEIEFGRIRPKNTSMEIERLTRETKCKFTPISDCIEHVAKNWVAGNRGGTENAENADNQ